MIYNPDNSIKLGGETLPGVVKKFELTSTALIEEVEVQGSRKKPKQATGYDSMKFALELILDDTEQETALQQLAHIQALHRASNQTLPQPLPIVSDVTATCNLTLVLLKSLKVTKANSTEQLTVALELWEHDTTAITVLRTGAAASSSASSAPVSAGGAAGTTDDLNDAYRDYLERRGTPAKNGTTAAPAKSGAPRSPSKTLASPAVDAPPAIGKGRR